jgi:mRNA-degrading endonuclease RelE of RelBE toxin-antitoxin system
MSWVCDLTDDTKRDLRDLPKSIQKRVARPLDQMHTNGNVEALQGDEWKGMFRRRLGDYRVLFLPDSRVAPTLLSISATDKKPGQAGLERMARNVARVAGAQT